MSSRPRALATVLSSGVLCVAALAVGCARPGGGPEGGPPDAKAPLVERISPDSGSTGVRPNAVVFHFDEVVSERPSGAASLDQLFVISPREGNLIVDWRRDAITVRPRRGWRPNTTYTISMLPGLADLRSNVRKDGASTIFSTGTSIPTTSISGVAFDWVQGRPPARGYAQAFVVGDTTLVWLAPIQPDGRFTLRSLPPNRYVVRAYSDDNNNSAFDPREAFDSTLVTLADSARLELYAFVHDTIGPRIESVTPEDSVTLRVHLDRALLPKLTVSSALFVLRAADSSEVRIAAAQAAPAFDSLRNVRQAARTDSLGRTNPDSVRRADPRFAARRDSASAARVDSLRRRAQGDTSARPVGAASLPMSRPRPVSDIVVTTVAPLKAATLYRLQARLVGLLGAERTSDRSFRTAAPPKPPTDSARVTAPLARPRPATQTPATAVPPSSAPSNSPAKADSVRRTPARP